jgi:predicted metalloendopeptidase
MRCSGNRGDALCLRLRSALGTRAVIFSDAQNSCGDTRPEQLRIYAQTERHSPYESRINGVVHIMPKFGEAFGCHNGRPMMPVSTCKVW